MDELPETPSIHLSPKSVSFWEQVGDTLVKVGEVLPENRELVLGVIRQSGPTHGNSKPVRAVAVDEAEAKKWLPPRGKAKPVYEDQLFPSASIASLHLGYSGNEVGVRLAHARTKEEKKLRARLGAKHTVQLRPSITVRGVTFQWEEDVPG